MAQWFSLGGFPMWITLAFGVLSIGSAARYAVRPERRFVPLVVSLGVMTLLNGVLGFVAGLIRSLNALDLVPAERRWIWMIGLGESLTNVVLALALVVLATLAMVIGTWKLSRAHRTTTY
jgi:hypothetical protein